MHIMRSMNTVPRGRALVTIVWLAGLIGGCLLASIQPKESIDLVRSIYYADAPISGLLITSMLPFAFSALVVWLRLPVLLLPIAFVKSICFSFCASCLILTFGNAGWLLYRFFIFSDSFAVVILLWFWNHHINAGANNLKLETVCCFLALFCIFFIDFNIVAPFARTLFKY